MAAVTDISVFKNKRVLILGDLILDRYLQVSSVRTSAEVPIPVYEVEKTTLHLGGAGNVASNITAMGATPFLLALGGNDCWQSAIRELLQGQQNFLIPSDRKSTLKTRLVEGRKQVVCFEEQDTSDMEDAAFDILQEQLQHALNNFRPDVVILQDYDRGFFTAKNIPFIIEICKDKGVPVAVDPKYRNFSRYRGVTLFKPNLAELRAGLGRNLASQETGEAAIIALNDLLHARNYLLTLSESGMYFSGNTGNGNLPSFVKNMIDVSGAGDTVISAAALGLASGWPISEIAHIANTAAAIACENPGIYPVSLLEIQDRLK